MLRSMYSGVSGMKTHQTKMDVIGNNIANVNTTGFKYSRANFSDLLSQTAKIATAPQGELGGKNAMQIGLGTQISTVTKIFNFIITRFRHMNRTEIFQYLGRK